MRATSPAERIRERAFYLWQNQTGECWTDPVANWLRAESYEDEGLAISPNWRFDGDSQTVWKLSDPSEFFGRGNPFQLDGASSDQEIAVKVLIWRDKIFGWYFDPLEPLVTGPGKFIAASILFSFIEGLEQIHSGPSTQGGGSGALSPSRCFAEGCRRMLLQDTTFQPDPPPSASKPQIWGAMYEAFRCGFAHDGCSRPSIQRTKDMLQPNQIRTRVGEQHELDSAVIIQSENTQGKLIVTISICPKRLLDVLRTEVETLATKLANPAETQLRTNFKALFKWPE